MEPVAASWADEGPISQGKILTLILQGREPEARELLKGWTANDLWHLENAASTLYLMVQEAAGCRRGSPD